jgi:hypothetical protein
MTSHIRLVTGLLSLGLVFASTLRLPPAVRASGSDAGTDHRAVIVELFTSEGCSSCPPADALLRQIDGKQTSDGRRIIGISEHVTYWNHLGWSDPFSSDVFTQRQVEYRRRFHLNSVYTPQMVIDGRDELVGSDRDGLLRKLENSRDPQSLTIQINSVVSRGNAVAVDYSLAGSLPSGWAEVVAVIADDEVRSNVARGENSGRVLTHVAVARNMKRVAATGTHQNQTLEISIAQAANKPQKLSRRLILFVQLKGQGRVLCGDEKSF